ncbi:MAG: hypothetical protein EKK55_05540 [Rhodocyclaceae bacterium]|nr:MAG: hypothetical protein EKK55_05540 [Rhodocyclaceae bacterium]
MNPWTDALLEAGLLPPRARADGPAFLRRHGSAWRTDAVTLPATAPPDRHFIDLLAEAHEGRRWRLNLRPIAAWSPDLGPAQAHPPPFVIVRAAACAAGDVALAELILFKVRAVLDYTGIHVNFTFFEPASLPAC